MKITKGARLSFVSVAVLVVVILIKSNTVNHSGKLITTTAKYGSFDIVVSVTGELEAASSVTIQMPVEMRNMRFEANNVKIQDMVAEGTSVDSGDYVASLDKSGIYSMLQDIESSIQDIDNQYAIKILDTTIQMKSERNKLIELEYAIEDAELSYTQSKYEPPATVRQNKIKLEKLQREKEQAYTRFAILKKQLNIGMRELELEKYKEYQQKEQLISLLDKFIIQAPAPGMVVYHRSHDGQKRTAGKEVSPYDPVVATLPDLTTMISKAYVNEIDISKIRVNQVVKIKVDAYPDKDFEGKVIQVSRMGQNLPFVNTKVYEVNIELDNSELELRPSMTTKNSIIISSHQHKLQLPLVAVHYDTVPFVFLNEKTKQLVELGAENQNSIIIEKGLSVDDEVLLTIPTESKNYKILSIDNRR